MIEKNKKGLWVNTSGNNSTVGNPFTAVAFRNLQKQILEKALVALENLPMERRDQSSLTMAMDSNLLQEVKECIKGFRKEMATFQSKSKKLDQIYHLSVSFYPVLENEKKEKNS